MQVPRELNPENCSRHSGPRGQALSRPIWFCPHNRKPSTWSPFSRSPREAFPLPDVYPGPAYSEHPVGWSSFLPAHIQPLKAKDPPLHFFCGPSRVFHSINHNRSSEHICGDRNEQGKEGEKTQPMRSIQKTPELTVTH